MMIALGIDPVARCCQARHALTLPPSEGRFIERPEFTGVHRYEFALPLDMCPTTNSTRGAARRTHGRRKARLWATMQKQYWLQNWNRETLAGRPQVLCVRFSSVAPDKYADWAKSAVDMLCCPTKRATKRLGIIRDDRPQDIDLHQWWEPAKRGEEFCYVQVRTGVQCSG